MLSILYTFMILFNFYKNHVGFHYIAEKKSEANRCLGEILGLTSKLTPFNCNIKHCSIAEQFMSIEASVLVLAAPVNTCVTSGKSHPISGP